MEVNEMKDGKVPDPNNIHPIAGYDKNCRDCSGLAFYSAV
jgi:hypothetical protein